MGFNLPSTSIEDCFKTIKDGNEYDRIMKCIYTTIRKQENEDFYLIGIDSIEGDVIEHELAHGLYFTTKEYKTEMDSITNELPEEVYEVIADAIIEIGYNVSVVDDEIQAYMSTGLCDDFTNKGLEDYREEYELVFKKYFKYKVEKIDLEL